MALAAVSVSLAAMAGLHLLAASQLNPVADTVSRYAHLDGGSWLFGIGALGMAVGFLALAVGLAAVGVRFDRATRTLAVAWGLSLVFVACFPSDPPGARHTVAGLVHNGASASIFLCLPAAGWRMSYTLTSHAAWRGLVRAVRWLAGGSVLGLVGFLVTHPPLNQWYGGTPLHGLPERILLGAQVALLLVLATRLLVVTRTRAPAVVVG
jgi:hypothetical protein